MAPSQTLHRSKRANHQRAHRLHQKDDRKLLIVTADTKVKLFDGYVQLTKDRSQYNIALFHIKAIYLQLGADVSLKTLWNLTNYFGVYFVDGRNFIIGKVSRFEKA